MLPLGFPESFFAEEASKIISAFLVKTYRVVFYAEQGTSLLDDGKVLGAG